MKKLVSLVLVLTFAFALTACSGKDMGRISYNLDMEDYVELGEYKGIKVDTNSDEYKGLYDYILKADVESGNLYVKITEGKLQKFDVANIDFVGKIDGKAFEGGTSKGYDLELGSGSFIDGFEDKLIGVEIGKTVDLELKFPNPYPNNPDLAGKDVVFTVKVNYVSSRRYTEGTLKNGDVVNIDFTGKIDGKEFDGGSAKGYDLTLGSGSFIPGFEDGLIGKKIGDTVDLNLTFPTNYTAELAGKAVVFTVKVNYAEGKEAKKPEEFYTELGYKSVEEYYEWVKERTLRNIIMTQILEDSKIIEYPEEEREINLDIGVKKIEKAAASNGMSADMFAQYYLRMTLEDYKNQLIEVDMKNEMIYYAIFDKAGLTIDKDELVKKTKEIVASHKSDKVTEKTLKEENGDDYFETAYIQEKVFKYLIKNAKVS